MMLLVPVGAVAQDADAETDAPAESAVPAETADAAADDEAVAADSDADAEAADDAGQGEDAAADAAAETAPAAEADTMSDDEDIDFDAVTEPSPCAATNATPPEYKPPTRATSDVVANLSRANGTNRWSSRDVEPNRRELRFFVGSNVQSTNDDGLDAVLFEQGRFTSGRVGLEAALGGGLAIGANYAWGSDSSTIFDEIGTELDIQGADVFARYTFEPLPWLRPYLQAEVGFRAAELTLNADDTDLADDAIGFTYGGFGGFEIRYPARNVSIALFNEHGYQGTTPFSFDSARWSDSDAATVDLGDLEFAGYTWRMGVRFGVAF